MAVGGKLKEVMVGGKIRLEDFVHVDYLEALRARGHDEIGQHFRAIVLAIVAWQAAIDATHLPVDHKQNSAGWQSGEHDQVMQKSVHDLLRLEEFFLISSASCAIPDLPP
jgi:hypothetical protein